MGTFIADLVLQILSFVAQNERENIRKRPALPETQIMILEPFVLKGEETEKEWEYFRIETDKRAEKAKKVAEKFNLKFVPLQSKFDEKVKIAESSYWLWERGSSELSGTRNHKKRMDNNGGVAIEEIRFTISIGKRVVAVKITDNTSVYIDELKIPVIAKRKDSLESWISKNI